jgi:hypothetical protein
LSEEGEEEEGAFSGEVLVETWSSDEMAVWEGGNHCNGKDMYNGIGCD